VLDLAHEALFWCIWWQNLSIVLTQFIWVLHLAHQALYLVHLVSGALA
jgi:hypothetical protein